jgi:hypothetical protein
MSARRPGCEQQLWHDPALETAGREARRHRAAEERPAAARRHLAGHPRARRHDVLHPSATENVAAEEHLLLGAVRMEQDEPQRVTGVEVPDLVVVEPVEEGAARRVLAEEADARCSRRDVSAARVGLREERGLHRKRRQAEALDEELNRRIDAGKLAG